MGHYYWAITIGTDWGQAMQGASLALDPGNCCRDTPEWPWPSFP
jgi:hypothetical protein